MAKETQPRSSQIGGSVGRSTQNKKAKRAEPNLFSSSKPLDVGRELHTFGSGAVRRNIGGQIENPDAPTGLDWLNAVNPDAKHSWEEPRRMSGGNPALERQRLAQIMDPYQDFASPQGKALIGPRGKGVTGMSPLFADSAMPVTGADPSNPFTMGERGQVSRNINDQFNNIVSNPNPPFDPNLHIYEQQRLATRRPMSNDGRIANANFDLFNGGPDAAAMPKLDSFNPNESLFSTAPMAPQSSSILQGVGAPVTVPSPKVAQPVYPRPASQPAKAPTTPFRDQTIPANPATHPQSAKGQAYADNWRNWSPLALPNPHVSYDPNTGAPWEPTSSVPNNDPMSDWIVRMMTKLTGMQPEKSYYRAAGYNP